MGNGVEGFSARAASPPPYWISTPVVPAWSLVVSQHCWNGRSVKQSPADTPGQGPVPSHVRAENCMLSLVTWPIRASRSRFVMRASNPARDRSRPCRIGSGTVMIVWSAVTVLVAPPSSKVSVCVPSELARTASSVHPSCSEPGGSEAAIACGSWSLPPTMW
nr:hypothetical protein GCM10020093_092280 [Planobispora longispora]